jgi:hypothetical protein
MGDVDWVIPLLFGTDCEPGTGEVACTRALRVKGNSNEVERLTSSLAFFVKGAELEVGRTRAGRRVKSPLDDET